MEDEEAPYDLEIRWNFPYGSEIIEVESLFSFRTNDNMIFMTAKRRPCWWLGGDLFPYHNRGGVDGKKRHCFIKS
jgi:hypothetical protein